MRSLRAGCLLLLAVAAIACDGAGPSLASPEVSAFRAGKRGGSSTSITFLSPAVGAPAVPLDPVTFYAVQGQDRRVEIFYAPEPGSNNASLLLRLRVRDKAQIVRPDGTPLASGDSVRITIRVIDPLKLIVQFEPSGLRFSGNQVAELRMSYVQTNADLNNDGIVDHLDHDLEHALSLFRQESANDPWQSVSGSNNPGSRTIDAFIAGFTNYVIAY